MISNINGIKEAVYTNVKSSSKIEVAKVSTMKCDNYTSSSQNNIPIETIDFKNGSTDLETVKFIESEFKTKYGSWDDNKISLYDINSYKDLFPLELESGKVLAFGNNSGDVNEQRREICYDLTVKTSSGPVRLEIQLGNHFKDTPMDESTFKNTVLKGFIMLTEALKMDEEIGNKSLAGGSDIAKLEFNPATKSIDLKYLKDSILDSCDIQIAGNYDSEFRQKYVGRLNLDADPDNVKKLRASMNQYLKAYYNLKLTNKIRPVK